MKAKSIKGKSTEEIKTALEQSMFDGFKPTLALVFLSAMNEIEAICSLLDNEGLPFLVLLRLQNLQNRMQKIKELLYCY